MLQLLTSLPALYVCNVDEGSADKGNKYSDLVAERAAKDNAKSVVISAQIESEIALLDAAERAEFLETLGLEEPGLNRLIREAYKLLNLQTYFTVGPKEARAWTIHVGDTGPQAAGVIHTDFEKGYIRAETIAFDDFIKLGGEGRRQGSRQDAGRRQGIRRQGRRRDALPLQRLILRVITGRPNGPIRDHRKFHACRGPGSPLRYGTRMTRSGNRLVAETITLTAVARRL